MKHCCSSISIALLLIVSSALADTFITPNNQCSIPENDSSCTTLSQYAIANDSVENVTLNLLPGVHILESNLSINDSLSLVLLGSNTSDTVITCTNSTRLTFRNVQYLHIRNLIFIRCVGNILDSIESFVLVSSNFQPENQEPFFNGTLFFVLNTAHSQIEKSRFESFIAYGDEGAGVLTIHSSNVSIVDTIFANNSANFGGVLNINSDSNVTIINCTFQNNQAFMSGGAFYVQSSTLSITSSELCNNYAQNLGGAMYTNTSVVTFDDSVCVNNEAQRGGVVFADESTIYFQNCNISDNSASRGSVVYANFSSFVSTDSTFTMNRAGRGGVVYAAFGNASFMDCSCHHNIGSRGGVAYLFSSLVTFENTLSYNNTGVRGGAIYAFNKCSILLSNSNFSRNRGSVRGGLLFVVLDSHISILNSTISENKVDRNSVIYAEANTTMTISQSNFAHNVAGEVGAVLSAEKMKVYISDSRFFNNSSPIGIIIIAKSSLITEGQCVFERNSGSILIINSNATFTGLSEFYNNTHDDKFIDGRSGTVPELGGAITCLLSDVLLSGNTDFLHNHGVHGGAIVAFQCRLHVNDIVNIMNNTVDSTGGGIYATLSSIAFRGNSTIMSNVAQDRGGGIHAISTSVELFSGKLVISHNTATFGGGIFIEQNAKLYVIKEQYEYLPLLNHQRVELSSNTADYGGAIYVADNSTSGTCASNSESSLTNECFFQTLQAHISIRRNNSLNLKNIFFANNSASVSGATIYGGLLDRCTPGPNAEVIVNNMISNTDALKYLSIVSNVADFTDIASEPLRVCFCRENGGEMLPDCSFVPENINVMKGGRFTMLATAVDETNKTLPATIRTSLSSKTSGLNEGQLLQQTSYTCSSLEYNIASPDKSVDLLIFAGGPCRDQGRSQRSIPVMFESCKCGIGFQYSPSPSSCECVCDANLSEYITVCQHDTLSRTTNFWIDYTNLTKKHTCIVLFPSCPYDYCNPPNAGDSSTLVNLNVPDGADTQCAFNRTGLMCGSCQSGLSLSLGTSRCMQCTNSWIALLLLFAIFGIVLVSFVLLLNLTVAIGTINGLIFYCNIVIANSSILLPFPEPAKHFFISWINLDWGFETCFFGGMDAYSKTWLQFAFPFYIFFIVIAIIVISDKSTKFSKLLAGRNPVAALATLILLSYTKLLRTIIAALSYADLECVDGTGSRRVWLFDANIPYFEGKHIPLFIAAIIVVIFSLMYTFLLLFSQWLPLLPNWRAVRWVNSTKFKSFIETYHAPYHRKHRYWVGLLLLVRVFLYLVSAYNATGNPYISLYSVLFAISCLLVLRDLSRSIYKNWAIGALETSFLLNLLIFSGATLFVQDVEGNQAALAYTSVYITFALLLCILVYHLYIQFIFSTKLHQDIVRKFREFNKNIRVSKRNGKERNITTEAVNMTVIANEHPDEVTERYHEPLLDDDTQHSGSYTLVDKDSSTLSGVTHTVIDGICEGTPPLSASVNGTM